jgi:2-polyprenyl-3-methyl-5-hydroxy-6-metoxy-1,4-benzoquinol methylase
MSELAPGSILQRMYFQKRIQKGNYKTFCEIGSGNGFLSKLLLSNGLSGVGFDLNASACENNSSMNQEFIQHKKYQVINDNFLTYQHQDKYDVVFSCMVIEHLTDEQVKAYFEKCKELLNPTGVIIIFVPSSMKYWGIEDEIAGHFRRYEFKDFETIASQHHLIIQDCCGLTYPISNILFPLSNYLINRQEGYKKNLDAQTQTILSGNRDVKFKTSYPPILKLFLNEVVLYPLYVLQRFFKNNKNSMVIYCEMKKAN